MSLLLRQVVLDGKKVDILVENGLINRIAPSLNGVVVDQVIEGGGKAVVPGLYNGHTHAAMTLFRGYADDMELQSWLTTKIWPLEEKLTEELVYHGARLACLEMIKSGTVFFNDMYWHFHGTAKAVEEMGLRAALSAVIIAIVEPQAIPMKMPPNL